MLPTSREHHLIITAWQQHPEGSRGYSYGNQIRGKVVYIQPKKERWREDLATVHIVTSDWLDPYCYPAMYKTPKQTVHGFFMAHNYELTEDECWLFKGTFERVKAEE